MAVVSTVTVRPATLADAPAMADTVHEGFETYRAWTPAGWEPPPRTLHLASIRGRLRDPGTWSVMAECDGEPAGHAALVPARAMSRPPEPLDGLAHVWMLFLREAHWGTGLAADLLARTSAEAEARSYRAIRLFTPGEHARARRFYEREGWRLEGEPRYEPGLALVLVEYRRTLLDDRI